ncbi:unnamed protein product [Dovyalis caffra]|uniref:Biotin carboxyl carrier protein of acetyl-CoA carboxylase n=1 Tax=Dovyalis caffra TaxID=77055 RepID=A0AAV1RVT6_9ROSI|nr:unnamed protein product [Dovyalis caffra]
MASSLSATPSASMGSKTAAHLPRYNTYRLPNLSFRLSPKPKFRFFPKVAADGFSNAAASTSAKSEVPLQEAKDTNPSNDPSSPSLATEESISEFITEVLSLVKYCGIAVETTRLRTFNQKKEALPQPPSPAPPTPAMPAATLAASSPAPSAPVPSPSPPASKPAKSSHPALKCPMAGTFYRSPGPGEPPFVKVGDKVQKGQVVCIIEAMKLMNEIEADQTGTIVEILAEDGKSVSVDTPLLVIEP